MPKRRAEPTALSDVRESRHQTAAAHALVHRFHQGTAREIWKRYATTHLESAVASAVAAGVLRKEELPAELVRQIAGLIEFYEKDLSAS
jgi:hypothetical protein